MKFLWFLLFCDLYAQTVYFPFFLINIWMTIDGRLFVIFDYICTMVNFIGVGVILSKFWLVYFDIQMLKFNKNKVWRMAIDPINEGTGIYGTNWFVRNLNQWGNQYYLIKVIVLTSIVETIFVGLIDFSISSVASNIFEMFLFIGQIIIVIFIFGIQVIRDDSNEQPSSSSSTSSFVNVANINSDCLGIKQELRSFVFTMPISLLISYLLLILYQFTNNNSILYIWACWLLPYGIMYLFLVGVYPKIAFKMSMKTGSNNNNHKGGNKWCFLCPRGTTRKTVTDDSPDSPDSANSPNLRRPKSIGLKLQESMQLRVVLWSHLKSKLGNGDEDDARSSKISTEMGVDGTIGNHRGRSAVPSVSMPSVVIHKVNLQGVNISGNGKTVPVLTREASSTPEKVNNIIRSWRDVVSVYHGYEAFMNHLCGEYSIENLLFVHEVCKSPQIVCLQKDCSFFVKRACF